MKKLIKILIPFLCLNAGLLSSCGEDNRVQLTFGDIHATDVDDKFTVSDLQLKVSNKESFLLVVADTSCYCWNEFHPIIKAYCNDNHVACGYLKYIDFISYAPTYGISLTKGTTKFIVFNEGEAKIQLETNSEDKTMKDLASFKKFMDGNVRLPKAFLIKEEDYSTITSNGAVIYFERSQCSDCTYLNPTILTNYVKKHPDMQNLYVLDCQPWKSLSDEEYQAKKDQYGLSTKNNVNYGFGNGVFPFMSFIKNGQYLSGAVAFNDTIEKQNDKYIVTNSYYTTERESKLDYLANVSTKVIKGMEIPSSDVADNGEFITWMQDKATKYYEPIIDAFLDTYLPQVNYNL